MALPVLLSCAVFYNAGLAFINAHIMRIGFTAVAAAEISILAAVIFSCLVMYRRGPESRLLLGFATAFLLVLVSSSLMTLIDGRSISSKPVRDLLIIFSFGFLGISHARNGYSIKGPVTAIALAVLAFLFLELLRTDVYVKLFNVSSYYLNTRGIGASAADSRLESGLFITAGSFEGRFSFGFRQAQRLSSLFLEQTTHANFAIVLSIFAVGAWQSLGKMVKILIVATIIFIILGTDSRQAAAVCAVISAGYYVFPRINKSVLFLYMPTALFVMWMIHMDPAASMWDGDNIKGRLAYSANLLFTSDLSAIAGARMSSQIIDSGYTYLMYSQSLLGMILFWLFLCKFLPQRTSAGKRIAHGVMIFYTANLAVSGSTIFSIKTAAILWCVVGYFAAKEAISGSSEELKLPNSDPSSSNRTLHR